MSFLKRLIPLKAEMDVSLQALTAEDGRPFKGTAILNSKEGFKVDEIRMEIRVLESWQEPQWERDSNGNERQVLKKMEQTLYSQDVPVSSALEVGGGDRKEFPFEVTIPMRAPNKYGGSVSYALKAVAAVKGRPDVTKTVNPMVVPAVAATTTSPSAAVTQVIQKEVVKVPCKFCGNLVEISGSVNKCPSCGAPIGIG